MKPEELIHRYCKDNSALENVLLKHSSDVANRALKIADKHPEFQIDRDFLYEAADGGDHVVVGDEGAGDGTGGDDVDGDVLDDAAVGGGVDGDGGAAFGDFGVLLEEAEGDGAVGVDVGGD